jgi:hypothetical protein
MSMTIRFQQFGYPRDIKILGMDSHRVSTKHLVIVVQWSSAAASLAVIK